MSIDTPKNESEKEDIIPSDIDDGGISKKFLVIAVLVFIVIVSALVVVINKLTAQDTVAPKKMEQQITMIKPPPPPPPPEVEPPPPEEIEEEVEIEEEEPEQPDMPDEPADEPPPGENLGVDADGTAGTDGFGLEGRRGGRGLLSSGGGDTSQYKFFASGVQQEILEFLSQRKEIRRSQYTVVVSLWINQSGKVKKIELSNSTGNRELDSKLNAVLSQVKSVSEAPPQGLPQPIRLRINSRL